MTGWVMTCLHNEQVISRNAFSASVTRFLTALALDRSPVFWLGGCGLAHPHMPSPSDPSTKSQYGLLVISYTFPLAWPSSSTTLFQEMTSPLGNVMSAGGLASSDSRVHPASPFSSSSFQGVAALSQRTNK